jgi:hypothetical protein
LITSCTGIASSTSLPNTTPSNVRHGVQPLHLREVAQLFLLAAAQLAGQFDDAVALDLDPGRSELGQDIEGQLAGAGAEFEDVGALWAIIAAATWASAAPNSGDSSGAVVKSPSLPSLAEPPL